jgi:hypothetical protein
MFVFKSENKTSEAGENRKIDESSTLMRNWKVPPIDVNWYNLQFQ